jgi:S1-C subfamily serine protease
MVTHQEMVTQNQYNQSVLIKVSIKGEGPDGLWKENWSGSGVVIKHLRSDIETPKTLILSAAHVLEVPKIGQSDAEGNIATSVKIEVMDHFRVVCEGTPLLVGNPEDNDVATMVADCELGEEAPIASQLPLDGEKITVVGYPYGIKQATKTEGWYSLGGGDLLRVSAAAAPGNSGCAIYDAQGNVFSILVRGNPQYPHMSLGETLFNIKRVIFESQLLLLEMSKL